MINSLTLRLIKRFFRLSEDFASPKLYDDTTFYSQLMQDLKNCKREVIIESPFITFQRTQSFIPVFEQLMKRNIKVYVMTRNPDDLDSTMGIQSEREIRKFEMIGVQVFLSDYFSHRKLAILDRKIL